MILNYLKIAFRSLLASKTHSAINIVGLSLGIACCVLIVLFVREEFTFDSFNQKAPRIYRVYAKENWGVNQQFFNTVTPLPMGPALKENFAEVEQYCRFVKRGTQIHLDDKVFNETVAIADHTLFQIFDFTLLKGNRKDALKEQNNVVVTDLLAKKYFGDADPMNKVIAMQVGENMYDFTITGVAHVPSNSSIQFYLLINELNLPRVFSAQTLTSGWFNIDPETYVLLRDGVRQSDVEKKFPDVFKTLLGDQAYKNSKYAPGLQRLTSIHLDPSYPIGIATVNNPFYSYIVAAIATLILLVACINFVTLSVGKSLRRAREVGIRKVVGAARRQLIVQFIGEALILTLISVVVGLVIAELTLPLFNELSGKTLSLEFSWFIAMVVFSLTMIIGLIAGSYPAFFLSGFKPISILKGSVEGNHKQTMRKVLVGAQMTLSIFLISSTLIMRNQLNYLRNKDLGFDKEQLLVIQMRDPRNGKLPDRVTKGFGTSEKFKNEMAKITGVVSVCASSHEFGNGGWANVGFTDLKGTYHTFDFNSVDASYIPVMKMKLVAGRNFSDHIPSDKRAAIIVNESLVKEYGWKDPIGQKLPGKDFIDHEIIGVVRDFNYSSLYTAVSPLVLDMNPSICLSGAENVSVDATPFPKLMIRIQPGNITETIGQLQKAWLSLSNDEFEFHFVDQTLATQYQADQHLGRIVSIATLLAIFIGSLGLYGLVSLAMQNRTKEISIRKVLGASEQSLLYLLSADYVKLIVICLAISIPFTIYLMQLWLRTFEFRVPIGWNTFALAGLISFVIAMATIGHQTLRALWIQPADSLRHE